jgi:hypothetical protein
MKKSAEAIVVWRESSEGLNWSQTEETAPLDRVVKLEGPGVGPLIPRSLVGNEGR